MKKQGSNVSIKEALAYPFINFSSFWNFWWILIPIIGWFYFAGYVLQVLGSVIDGGKELPKSKPFWENVKDGFWYSLYLVPLYIVLGIIGVLLPPWAYHAISFIVGLPLIYLVGMYIKDRRFVTLYRYDIGYKLVQKNIKTYLIWTVLAILVALIWIVASIPLVTMIITLPAMQFGMLYAGGRLYRESNVS